MRNEYKILVRKSEETRPHRGLMPRGSRDADWINLAQDAVQCRSLMTTVMNIGVALKAGSFLSNCTTVSFSRRTEFYGIVPIIIIIM